MGVTRAVREQGIHGAHVELSAQFRGRLRQAIGRRAPVAALLTHEAHAVSRETSVESVASFFLTSGANAVPVVNDDGALVGLVTTRELLGEAGDHREAIEEEARLRVPEARALRTELRGGYHGTCLTSAKVGDVMASAPPFITPETSVQSAAELMSLEGVNELPVRCPRCQGYCVLSAVELLGWLS